MASSSCRSCFRQTSCLRGRYNCIMFVLRGTNKIRKVDLLPNLPFLSSFPPLCSCVQHDQMTGRVFVPQNSFHNLGTGLNCQYGNHRYSPPKFFVQNSALMGNIGNCGYSSPNGLCSMIRSQAFLNASVNPALLVFLTRRLSYIKGSSHRSDASHHKHPVFQHHSNVLHLYAMTRLAVLSALLLFTSTVSATVGGHCVGVKNGVCLQKSDCVNKKGSLAYNGYSNKCPYDGNSVKCCTADYCGPKGNGICKFTGDGCSGGQFLTDEFLAFFAVCWEI